MSSGKWGAWALIAPQDEAMRSRARARVDLAAARLQTQHPNLERVADVTVPLASDAGQAATEAYALADIDVLIADVTEPTPALLFFLGSRDLIEKRLTIALHEGDPPADLEHLFGARLVRLDPANPGAAQDAVAGIVTWDANGADNRYESAIRTRLGAYTVARKPKTLRTNDKNALAADLRGPWSVAAADGGAAPRTVVEMWWGDVADITRDDEIHALVNSENTYFEMGRIHDRGLSAVIRCLGANWGDNQTQCDDALYRELLSKVRERPSPPGTVIVTRAHRLKSKGLHAIAHVASVQPRAREGGGLVAGMGYVPVANLPGCVHAALNALDKEFVKRRSVKEPTVLFPLIGTGNAAGDTRTISRQVITGVVDYVRDNPDMRVSKILISAYTDRDLDFCADVLRELRNDGRITKP